MLNLGNVPAAQSGAALRVVSIVLVNILHARNGLFKLNTLFMSRYVWHNHTVVALAKVTRSQMNRNERFVNPQISLSE